MRRLADLAMSGLARVLIRVFFRQVEIDNPGGLSSDRPTVLVANHRNGLVDGLLLMATLRRYPRFLGKSTLYRIPPLWPFLVLAGVVPVHRARDGGSMERNAAAFRRCRALLARGGVIALFPEGISHDEPALQPLRTGAARIALGASADDGMAGVEVVAVGLIYDAKATFRSRALVRVGTPEPVERWNEAYRDDDHDAVRMLTDAVAEQLRAVNPDHASWLEADRLKTIAEVVIRHGDAVLPEDVDLDERERVADALATVIASGGRRQATAALRRAFEVYDRDLALLGMTDAQVSASYRSGHLRLRFLGAVAKVIAAAPFAALGTAIHVIPYEAVKQLARLPENEGMRATVKVVGCFFTFTAFYAALGIVVGSLYGPLLGAVAAVAAPGCGYVTVRMAERLHRIGGAVEGARAVRGRGPAFESVLANRAAVLAAAEDALAPAHSP